MVNLVEDWEVLEEYAGDKRGFYQILYGATGVEVRVAVGRLEFKNEFESAKDPLLNRILSFCNSQKYVKVSENIRDEMFDRILLVCCLPEIPDPVRALRELHRILKPNGLLCLVEVFLDPDYPLRRTEIKWAKDAGFTLDSKHGNWFIYYLNFSKFNERKRLIREED